MGKCAAMRWSSIIVLYWPKVEAMMLFKRKCRTHAWSVFIYFKILKSFFYDHLHHTSVNWKSIPNWVLLSLFLKQKSNGVLVSLNDVFFFFRNNHFYSWKQPIFSTEPKPKIFLITLNLNFLLSSIRSRSDIFNHIALIIILIVIIT